MDDGRGDEDSDIIDYFCDGMMAAQHAVSEVHQSSVRLALSRGRARRRVFVDLRHGHLLERAPNEPVGTQFLAHKKRTKDLLFSFLLVKRPHKTLSRVRHGHSRVVPLSSSNACEPASVFGKQERKQSWGL